MWPTCPSPRVFGPPAPPPGCVAHLPLPLGCDPLPLPLPSPPLPSPPLPAGPGGYHPRPGAGWCCLLPLPALPRSGAVLLRLVHSVSCTLTTHPPSHCFTSPSQSAPCHPPLTCQPHSPTPHPSQPLPSPPCRGRNHCPKSDHHCVPVWRGRREGASDGDLPVAGCLGTSAWPLCSQHW